ncbi:hypothetical protein [Mesorhizobium sp. B2-4-17]|uniref:alpha/beta fold hydrolase n=1 Tax=Mesorhizobium sp. B2-4-17 TaxID=2589932 RepID=UPI00112BA54F|nr:hypothetical protein [Mesorhizobium sp. B2-4-17]TPK78145.1 hypothetical protein FJ548_25440 [Mesorhizobium sp. B2-4-17]
MTASRDSTITAPTQFLAVDSKRYAYRRFGAGAGLPLFCLQHFQGTLDYWDPAVVDPLAEGREVILFDKAGVGRSNGTVPGTIADMTAHAIAFLDGLRRQLSLKADRFSSGIANLGAWCVTAWAVNRCRCGSSFADRKIPT